MSEAPRGPGEGGAGGLGGLGPVCHTPPTDAHSSSRSSHLRCPAPVPTPASQRGGELDNQCESSGPIRMLPQPHLPAGAGVGGSGCQLRLTATATGGGGGKGVGVGGGSCGDPSQFLP